jgi:REP element-mobilizing transposase RayT
MRYDPDKHHRRSVRLQQFDYASNGAYFVTVVTQGRQRFFGDIGDGIMAPNDAGRMVAYWWDKIPEKFSHVEIDEFVVMPNHFHAVLTIDATGRPNECGRPHGVAPTDYSNCRGAPMCTPSNASDPSMRPEKKFDPNGLSGIVGWFKTMTTNAYITGIHEQGWPPFEKRFWQRNYHEHIIRDEGDLFAIRQYIAANPAKWAEDKEFI